MTTLDTSPFCTTVPSEASNPAGRKKEPVMTSTNAITRRIIDTSTEGLPPGYETGETSQAKNIAYEILEYDYIPDSGDAITASDRVVEALIKAGWRPTVEEPTAEHHAEPNADGPTDAEVQAAGEAIYATATGLIPPTCNLGTYWTDLARVALRAARKVSAPPPSEPIVEAAAQAMSNCDRPARGLTPEWDQREPEERNRYRALAHVAIRTAWQASREVAGR